MASGFDPRQCQGNLPNRASQTVPSTNHQNRQMLQLPEQGVVALRLWDMDPRTSTVRAIVRNKIFEYLSKLPIFLGWEQKGKEKVVEHYDEILFANARTQVDYMNLDTLEKRLNDFLKNPKDVGDSNGQVYGVSSPSTGSMALSYDISCNREPSLPDILYTNTSSSFSDYATLSSKGSSNSFQALDLISNPLPGCDQSTPHARLPNRHHGVVANGYIAPARIVMNRREAVSQPGSAVSLYGTEGRHPPMTSSNHYIGKGENHTLGAKRTLSMYHIHYGVHQQLNCGSTSVTEPLQVIEGKNLPESHMHFIPDDNLYSSGKLMIPDASFASSANVHLLGSQTNLIMDSTDNSQCQKQKHFGGPCKDFSLPFQMPHVPRSQSIQPQQKRKHFQQPVLVENKLSELPQPQKIVIGSTQVKGCTLPEQLLLNSGEISQQWSCAEGSTRKKTPACHSVAAALGFGVISRVLSLRKHNFLIIYHHATCCSVQKGECQVPLCVEMKQFLNHLSYCKDDYCMQCCLEAKRIISHYRNCTSYICDICGPLRMGLEKGLQSTSVSQGTKFTAGSVKLKGTPSSSCSVDPELPLPKRMKRNHPSHTRANIPAAPIEAHEEKPPFSSYVVDHEQPLSKHAKMGYPSLPCMSQNEAAEEPFSAVAQECQGLSTTVNISAESMKHNGPSFRPYIDFENTEHPSLVRSSQDGTAEATITAMDQELGMLVNSATDSTEKLDIGPSSCFPQEIPAEHFVVNNADTKMDITMKSSVDVPTISELTVAQPEQGYTQVLLETGKHELKERCVTTESCAVRTTGKNMDRLMKNGISLINFFTQEEIIDHLNSLKPLVGQTSQPTSEPMSKENAEEKKGMGHVMDENTCSLCAMKNLRFEPPARYCASCFRKIKPKGCYYFIESSETGSGTQDSLCTACHRIPGANIKVGEKCIPKANLKKRVNYAEAGDLDEQWVQCGKCKARQHQICALVNFSGNEAQTCYTCPTCLLQEIKNEERAPLPRSTVLGAEDLPTTMLSDHIEKRLYRRLREDRQERANSLGKDFFEVPGAEGLVVRVVSSFVTKVEVKQAFRDIFQKEKYPSEFPYKSKAILLFQQIDGADVFLFGMYVQEYGAGCAFPNKRQVCISYIDSVKYFKPNIEAASGEALRTFVYHEILVGYLDYCKKRGFTSCYIWVCPPLKRDDYILYCHPKQQKMPEAGKLRKWYHKQIKKAQKEGIVVELTNLHDQFFVHSDECKAKITAARLPYYDNDFWPREADQILQTKDESKFRKKGTKAATARILRAVRRDISIDNPKDALLMHQNICLRCFLRQLASISVCFNLEVDSSDSSKLIFRLKGAIDISWGVLESMPRGASVRWLAIVSLCFNLEALLKCMPHAAECGLQLAETIRPIKNQFMMVHLQHFCKHCCDPILSGKQWVCSICKNFRLCEICFLREKNLDKKDRHPISADEKHSFHEVEVEVFADSDEDEILQSEIFDTRFMFLGYCQKFHYQFDTLRIAKHSSMMILHDLHKAAALSSTSSCIGCYNDIDGSHESITACVPDQNSQLSSENKHAMPQTDPDGAVVHATTCLVPRRDGKQCGSTKRLLHHVKHCPTRAKGGCSACMPMWSLLKQHAQESDESHYDEKEESRTQVVLDSQQQMLARTAAKERMKERIKRQNEEKNKRRLKRRIKSRTSEA